MSLIEKKEKGLKNYPKTWENLLQNLEFAYAGDVISSTEYTIEKELTHKSESPEFFKIFIQEVYEKSIQSVFEKSIEISSTTEIKNLDELLSYAPHLKDYKFVFISKNAVEKIKNRNIFNDIRSVLSKKLIIPDYYDNYYQSGDFKFYFTPLIEDNDDCLDFYFTDRPIQSFVWILQNCEYKINSENMKHSVKYPLYDCDFNSRKISIKNIEKIREDKLKILLDGK